MKQEEIVLFWSGGKDSALALYKIRREQKYKVRALITTINEQTNTVPFHGIGENLLIEQAKLIGIPLHRVYIPDSSDNKTYNKKIELTLSAYIKKGITKAAFGDIHLKDIRKYREVQMNKIGMECLFPLWGCATSELQKLFFQNSFRAVVTSILDGKTPQRILGKELTEDLIQSFPKELDPFGERGEFHTLVTFTPYFKSRLQSSISVTNIEGPYQVCQLRLP